MKHVFTTTTHHWMLFFTTKGRVYRVKAHEIPESGRTARGCTRRTCRASPLDGDEKISAVIDLKEYAEGTLPAVRHAQGHREEDQAARVRLAAHAA